MAHTTTFLMAVAATAMLFASSAAQAQPQSLGTVYMMRPGMSYMGPGMGYMMAPGAGYMTGPGMGYGMMGRGMMGRGMMGPGMMGYGMIGAGGCGQALLYAPLPALTARLGLSPAQVEKIEAIRSNLLEKTAKHRSKIQVLWIKKQALMQQQSPPEAKVLQVERQIRGLWGKIREEHIKARLHIGQVLSAKQRTSVQSACTAPGPMGWGGPGRMWGMW